MPEENLCRFDWQHDYRWLYNMGDNRYFERCLICGAEREGWNIKSKYIGERNER